MTNKKSYIQFDPKDHSLAAISSHSNQLSGLTSQRRQLLETVLKDAISQIGTLPKRVVLAQVLIALKIEGIISDRLTDDHYELIYFVTNAILKDSLQLKETQRLIKKLT